MEAGAAAAYGPPMVSCCSEKVGRGGRSLGCDLVVGYASDQHREMGATGGGCAGGTGEQCGGWGVPILTRGQNRRWTNL